MQSVVNSQIVKTNIQHQTPLVTSTGLSSFHNIGLNMKQLLYCWVWYMLHT